MKRKLIGSILGIGAVATMAHAQGFVLLNNYHLNYNSGTSSYTGSPVKYGVGSGGTLGALVTSSSGYHLDLAYDIVGGANTFTDAGTPQSGPAGALNAAFTEITGTQGTIGLNGNTADPGFAIPSSALVTIPGYASGDISFEFLAFNGSSYGTSSIRGHSAAVTYSSIATGTSPAAAFKDSLNVGGFPGAFYVVAVPEPTTLAVVGLGAAGLMFFRRRKA